MNSTILYFEKLEKCVLAPSIFIDVELHTCSEANSGQLHPGESPKVLRTSSPVQQSGNDFIRKKKVDVPESYSFAVKFDLYEAK